MRSVVLDTSALLRLYVPDGPLPTGTEEALEAAWRAEAMIFVPELALVEAAQVLQKKVSRKALSTIEADEILTGILELPLEVVGHRELVAQAVEIARARGLSVYDALFCSLAASENAELISADARLVRAWEQEPSAP